MASGYSFLNSLFILFGAVTCAAMVYAAFISFRENERRALCIFTALAILLPLPYLVAGCFHFTYQAPVAGILIFLTGGILLLFFFPVGRKQIVEDDDPVERIDERDIMFSRNLLEAGTERYSEYYARHPDKKVLDDKFRSRPGLLKPGATYFHPYAFSSANASFITVEHLRDIVEGKPAEQRVRTDAEKITVYIKHWARKLGALHAGVTRLKNYHLYTHVGRGPDYGKPVTLQHAFAIVFTVEMDKRMLDSAPAGPTVMESSQQYLASGTIAVQVAQFIRNLGYPARAHIDGNYRIVCPLVARDAGLGEIGRMGLLMTPSLGPRVRISAVTTDLPLAIDTRKKDFTMTDFCRQCKKCANICPAGAIPAGDRQEIGGVKRWQINQEGCFTFWCQAGTDCALCVRACPFSHPDNAFHNTIRYGVRKSSLFRRLAVSMDDLFYGSHPPPGDLPRWM